VQGPVSLAPFAVPAARFAGLALLALFAFAPLATPAPALTLADLAMPGATLTLADVELSDFDVVVSGALDADLESYAVQVLPDGFRVVGGLTSVLGEAGTLLLSYTATALGPSGIVGAALFGDGVVVGTGAATVATASLFAGGTFLGTLVSFAVEGNPSQPQDALGFPAEGALRVVSVAQVEGGILAMLPFVEQRFTAAVPEPATFTLLALGLVGLAVAGRPRRQSDPPAASDPAGPHDRPRTKSRIAGPVVRSSRESVGTIV
jgi:hypothetical protein